MEFNKETLKVGDYLGDEYSPLVIKVLSLPKPEKPNFFEAEIIISSGISEIDEFDPKNRDKWYLNYGAWIPLNKCYGTKLYKAMHE